MGYLGLFLKDWRYLTFGSLLTCLGTLGSGYFVGLFNRDIRLEFGLSHADIGVIFSVTTVASGPILIWLGRKIDEVDLRFYTVSLCVGFAAGCFLLASSASIIAVGIGIFLVRLIGDWLIVHTAVTSMARHFGAQRGRAMGLGAIGYAVGPAVFPVVAVLFMDWVGWRATWAGIGWSLAWLASCFVGFAIGKVATVLIVGPMIDKFGAIRLLSYYPLPLGLGLLALAVSDHPGVALAYLVGCGISTGMWLITLGALWAEMYGVAHLGAIRSMAQAIFVLSVALATVGMGWLLDLGITFETIALGSVGYIALSMALSAFLALRPGRSAGGD